MERLLRDWNSSCTKSDSMRVEIEELESLLGPEDSEVDLRQFLRYASGKKGWQDLRSFQLDRSQLSTWLPAECDGTSVERLTATQEEEARRNVQEGTCKKLTTK